MPGPAKAETAQIEQKNINFSAQEGSGETPQGADLPPLPYGGRQQLRLTNSSKKTALGGNLLYPRELSLSSYTYSAGEKNNLTEEPVKTEEDKEIWDWGWREMPRQMSEWMKIVNNNPSLVLDWKNNVEKNRKQTPDKLKAQELRAIENATLDQVAIEWWDEEEKEEAELRETRAWWAKREEMTPEEAKQEREERKQAADEWVQRTMENPKLKEQFEKQVLKWYPKKSIKKDVNEFSKEEPGLKENKKQDKRAGGRRDQEKEAQNRRNNDLLKSYKTLQSEAEAGQPEAMEQQAREQTEVQKALNEKTQAVVDLIEVERQTAVNALELEREQKAKARKDEREEAKKWVNNMKSRREAKKVEPVGNIH